MDYTPIGRDVQQRPGHTTSAQRALNLVFLVALSGCGSNADTVNPATTATDSSTTPANPMEQQWVVNLAGEVSGLDGSVQGFPLLASGRVHIAVSDNRDGGDAALFALDAGSGQEVWRYVARGDDARGSPVVSQDGGAIALTVDNLVSDTDDLVVVDAQSGTESWKYSFDVSWNSTVTTVPTIHDAIVFVGAERIDALPTDEVQGFSAFDLVTGDVLWTSEEDVVPWVEGFVDEVSASVVSAYLGPAGESGVFARGTSDGVLRWSKPMCSGGFLWEIEPLDDDVVLVSCVDLVDDSSELVALELTSQQELWSVTTDFGFSISVHDDLILLSGGGPNSGMVTARSTAGGTFLWEMALERPPPGDAFGIGQDATMVDGTLFVASEIRVFALDPLTGSVQWEHEVNGLQAVVASDGLLIVVTEEAEVMAFSL